MGPVEHRFTVELEASQESVFALVSDLATYDGWLDIVQRVERDPATDEAWFVTLRAKLGPLARSKRLRMVRVAIEAPTQVRFERQEVDGKDHSAWVLSADLEPGAAAGRPGSGPTRLTMNLDYGGRLWTSALAPILDAQVGTATRKLGELASAPAR